MHHLIRLPVTPPWSWSFFHLLSFRPHLLQWWVSEVYRTQSPSDCRGWSYGCPWWASGQRTENSGKGDEGCLFIIVPSLRCTSFSGLLFLLSCGWQKSHFWTWTEGSCRPSPPNIGVPEQQSSNVPQCTWTHHNWGAVPWANMCRSSTHGIGGGSSFGVVLPLDSLLLSGLWTLRISHEHFPIFPRHRPRIF